MNVRSSKKTFVNVSLVGKLCMNKVCPKKLT